MKRCPVCQDNFPQEFLICPKDAVRLEDNSAEALIGQTLNEKYLLERHIASGGMASIFAAKRLEIGDTVAVKILTPDALRNPLAVVRFKRESQAAARIKHKGVVSVYDFSTLPDGRTFMVMEYLLGQSLRDELTTCGHVAPDRMLRIMEDVCPAMQAAHDAGIIHRDLKPENIMAQVNPDGGESFKVVDFGVAELREQAVGNALTKLTEAGMMVGTPYYMSPEQCRSQELDARSDIYSLGIILYEMLTGTVPFTSRTLSAVIIQQVTEDPRPLRDHSPEISWALENVVLRALSKQREARQQSAAELLQELRKAVAAEPLSLSVRQDNETDSTSSDFFSTPPFPILRHGGDIRTVNYDALTGVYSGAFFQRHIEELLIHAAQAKEEVAVVLVRVERLQQLNESQGFGVGDRIMRHVAEWLSTRLRAAAVVGRTGGDEFAVVFAGDTQTSAGDKANQLIAFCTSQHFLFSGVDADINLLTAQARFPDDAPDAARLIDIIRERLAARYAEPQPVSSVPALIGFNRFVGREQECRQLLQEFDRAAAGRGEAVFLCGAAGLGKTRLVDEFRRRLAGRKALVLRTRFYESGGLLPYRAYHESLSGMMGYLLEVAENRLHSLFGSVAPQAMRDFSDSESMTFTSQTGNFGGEQEKFRVFDYLTRLYLGLTRIRPVVLVVDDLHWADVLSLEFLAYLIRNTPGHPFMLVACMRDREAASREYPLMNWLRQMSRTGTYTMLTLRPFDDAEMRSLIRLIFDEKGISEPMTVKLLNEARGNPFYLQEILRWLVNEKSVEHEDGQWVCREFSEIRLPESIVDLVEAHLRCLDSETLEVLSQAAAIGEEFTYEVLEAVTEMDESVLLPILEKALKNSILQEHPSRREDRYIFAHTTFRKVLYEHLTKRRRKRLHRHIGNVLAQIHAERSSLIAADLAHHYLAADDLEHALIHTIEAGNQAWRGFAVSEAARYYTLAESIIERLGSASLDDDVPVMQMAALGLHLAGDKLAEYHLNYGCICIQQGKAEKAQLELEQALGFGKQIQSQVLTGRALTALAELNREFHDFQRGIRFAEEALDVLRAAGDIPGEIRALMEIAAFHDHQGRYGQTAQSYEAALRLAREVGDRAGEAGALWGIGTALFREGRYEAAVEAGEKSLALTREIGDRFGERRSLSLIGLVHLDLGNNEEAKSHFDSALKVVREIGYRMSEGPMLNNIGEALRQQRRFTEALVYYQESLEVAREVNDRYLRILVMMNIGMVEQGRNRHQQALEIFTQSLGEIPTIGSPSLEFDAHMCMAESLFALKRFTQSKDAFQAALVINRETGSKREEWKALYGLARCERELGESHHALGLLRRTVASLETLAAGFTSYTDRNRFLKDMHRVYNDLAELAVELGEDM